MDTALEETAPPPNRAPGMACGGGTPRREGAVPGGQRRRAGRYYGRRRRRLAVGQGEVMAGGRAAARPPYRPSRRGRSPPGPGGPRRSEAGACGEGPVRAVTSGRYSAAVTSGVWWARVRPRWSRPARGLSLRASAAFRCARRERGWGSGAVRDGQDGMSRNNLNLT